ncbi:outer membrane protein, cobalt-zinc-cadmium efflux system [Chitinophaga sp. YR573]|nr:outer membrane protein, cobalt-zinc-cadmium efflux system [Chitinophaga sp. YR573]
MQKYILSMWIILCICMTAHAQLDTGFVQTKLSLTQYLSLVGRQNLSYAAQQYNVNIAEAGIESAKVFPDPQLTFGAYDNQQSSKHLGQGYNAGIGTTLELGGKRKSRIDLAQSQVLLSKALLQDYFRNLQADASIAYFNALQQYNLLEVQQNSYATMAQLADADAIRFKLGAITEVDARQSKLEAGSLLNSLYQNEADWKTALVQLSINTGKAQSDTLLTPISDSDNLERDFALGTLIINAQNNRADVVAAINNKTVADKNLQLIRANRKIDLGISAGVQYSGEATNDIAPTPAYRSINAGISIPLKFSNRYKGEMKAAQYSIRQSAVQYDQVLLQIQTEVTQSYFNYKAAQKQVSQFKSGLLTEAQKVLTGKIYSYKRGETSLLEVLNAQRTYNDVQQNYYQSLFNYAAALVNLERSAGIWDIQ